MDSLGNTLNPPGIFDSYDYDVGARLKRLKGIRQYPHSGSGAIHSLLVVRTTTTADRKNYRSESKDKEPNSNHSKQFSALPTGPTNYEDWSTQTKYKQPQQFLYYNSLFFNQVQYNHSCSEDPLPQCEADHTADRRLPQRRQTTNSNHS